MPEDKLMEILVDAAELPADQQIDFLLSKGVPEDQMDECLEAILMLDEADETGDGNIVATEPGEAAERLASDKDAALEEKAQKMADEDDSKVKVTSVDKDGDGDTDKETIEKKNPDDDEVKNSEAGDKPHDSEVAGEDLSDEEVNQIADELAGSFKPKNDVEDAMVEQALKNVNNKTGQFAKHLAQFKW